MEKDGGRGKEKSVRGEEGEGIELHPEPSRKMS